MIMQKHRSLGAFDGTKKTVAQISAVTNAKTELTNILCEYI